MIAVPRADVLKAADWCARRAAHWDLIFDVRNEVNDLWEPIPYLCMEAMRAARKEHGEGRFVAEDWRVASSMLYAAALEGRPMPNKWLIA